jgi:hypothetical protein
VNHDLTTRITNALSNELRRTRYRSNPNPLAGHCYVASEAAFHLLGGKAAGWTPNFIQHEGEPHWFLRHHSGKVLDITASQFSTPVPYHEAVGKGFLTSHPSKRAQVVLSRLDSSI